MYDVGVTFGTTTGTLERNRELVQVSYFFRPSKVTVLSDLQKRKGEKRDKVRGEVDQVRVVSSI